MTIHEILKARREQLGLSLEDVAVKVGVNGSTVSRWETGNIDNMRRDKIVKLAEALHISPAVIMGWELPPSEEEATETEMPTIALDDEQQEVLDLFNSASPEIQAAVLAVLRSAELHP